MLLMALLALPSWGQTVSRKGDVFVAGDYKCTVLDFDAKTVEIIGYLGSANGELVIPTTVTTSNNDVYTVTYVSSINPVDGGSVAGITKITVSDGIPRVAGLAYGWGTAAPNLTAINLPASITDVSSGIGVAVNSLNQFQIAGSKDNMNATGKYFTVDGVLYRYNGDSKSEYVLVAYPDGRPGNEDQESSYYEMNQYKETYYTEEEAKVSYHMKGELKSAELKEGAQLSMGQSYRIIDNTVGMESNAFYRVTCKISKIILPVSMKDIDPLIHTRLVMWAMENPDGTPTDHSDYLKIGQNTDLSENGLYDYGVLYKKLANDSLKTIGYPKLANVYGVYNMPDAVKEIGAHTFSFGNLRKVNISPNVEELSGNVFRWCGKMTDVNIHASVKKMGSNVFWESEGVYRIHVDPNNPYYQNIHVPSSYGTAVNPIYSPSTGAVWKDYVVYTKPQPDGLFDGGLQLVAYPVDYVGNDSIVTKAVSGNDTTVCVYRVAEGTIAIAADVFNHAGTRGIILPNTLESIENSAFHDNPLVVLDFQTAGGGESNLKYIGASAFSGCADLVTAVIPSTVERIGGSAFENCVKLKNLSFDATDALTQIGDYAFSGCSSLEKALDLSKCTGLDKIGERTFNNVPLTSVVLPSSITEIGPSAFSKDEAAKTSAGESVTDKLTSFTFVGGQAPNLTTIGDNAFQNNKACTFKPGIFTPTAGEELEHSNYFRNSITKVGNRAFYGCDAIQGVIEIGDQILALGSQTFTLCPNVTSFEVLSDNPNYRAIDGMLLTKNGKKLLSFPGGKTKTEFDFQNGKDYVMVPPVEEIGDSVFYEVHGVSDIKVPATVKKVGKTSFYRCFGLNNLSLMCEEALDCDIDLAADDNVSKSATLLVRKNVADNYRKAPWYDQSNNHKFKNVVTSFATDLAGLYYRDSYFAAPEYFPWTEEGGLQNKEVALVGFDSSNEHLDEIKAVIIPAKIREAEYKPETEYDVNMIGENAFANLKNVESATLYCSPRYFGSGAFTVYKDAQGNLQDDPEFCSLKDLYLVNPTKKTQYDGKNPLSIDNGNLGVRFEHIYPQIYNESSYGQTMYVKESIHDDISQCWLTSGNSPRVTHEIKKVAPNAVKSRSYSATTFCREFPVKFSDDVEVYRVEDNSQYARDDDERNEVDKGTGITGYLKACKVDNTHVVPAGEAVLVVNKNGSTELPNAYYQIVDDNSEDAAMFTNNGMVGAYCPIDLTAHSTDDVATGYQWLPINTDGTQKNISGGRSGVIIYALSKSNGWFSQVDATVKKFPAYKGFFTAPSTTNLSKGFLMFDLDGEIATAIDRAIQAEDADATWYNVDGSKLEGRPSVKGVYIRNGKKFVVK
jgi:hypothetical protein